MLGDSGIGSKKGRQRGLLDLKLWIQRNPGCVGCTVISLIALGLWLVISMKIVKLGNTDSLGNDKPLGWTSGQGKGSRNAINKQKRTGPIITQKEEIQPDPANMCVAFRATDGCSAEGPRDASKDMSCSGAVTETMSGHCECLDGEGNTIKLPYDCAFDGDLFRDHFSCSKACLSHILGLKRKAHKLSKAEQSKLDHAAEEERKRMWEAEEEEALVAAKKAEQDKEKQAEMEKQEEEADELLAEVHTMIEEKRWDEARKSLRKVQELYEAAGVVDLKGYDVRHLYKKPHATRKEMALSGIADRLDQAWNEHNEQKEADRRAAEEAKAKREQAIRAAEAAADEYERQELDKKRKAFEERNKHLQEIAKRAQQEAIEMAQRKKRLREEEEEMRKLTPEQIQQRERNRQFKAREEERKRRQEMRRKRTEQDDQEAAEAEQKFEEFRRKKKEVVIESPSPASEPKESASVEGEQKAESEGTKAEEPGVAQQPAKNDEPPTAPGQDVEKKAEEEVSQPASEMGEEQKTADSEQQEPANTETEAPIADGPAGESGKTEVQEGDSKDVTAETGAVDAGETAGQTVETEAEALLSEQAEVEQASGDKFRGGSPASSAGTSTEGSQEQKSQSERDAEAENASSGDNAQITSNLADELKPLGLEQYEEQLRELGVEHVTDFQYLDEETIDSLGAKPIHKKKLLTLVKKFHQQ